MPDWQRHCIASRSNQRESRGMGSETTFETSHQRSSTSQGPQVERRPERDVPLVSIPLVSIGGLPLAVIDRHESARLILDLARSQRLQRTPPAVITSANGQVISMAARNKAIR